VSDVPEITRIRKCDTCAFKAGTPANKSYTPSKAKLCAEIPEPFLCHEESEDIYCAGWQELMQRLLAEGFYAKQTEFHRRIKEIILESICKAEQTGKPGAFLEHFHELLQTVETEQP